MKKFFAAVALILSVTACSFVDTGEVGLKRNFDKTIDTTEVLAGDFRQTVVGEMLHFPVKDVSADVADMQPLAKDNSTMKDFDMTVVYSIDPSAVSDFYINKSKSFHATNDENKLLLMYSYVKQTARNAAYKAARDYEALTMNDNRQAIENTIRDTIVNTFAKEGLTGINISQVQVRSIQPADSVRASSDALVRAKNEEETKKVEVRIAQKEAERMAALAANSGQSIAYMQAQANMKIAEGIAAGKVQTIVVPMDFKGMVNVGK